MGFFKKLFDKISGTNPEEEPSDLPAEIELVENELWVEVAVHQIPKSMNNNSSNALSFLTRGMINQNQQELFFVLKTNHVGIHDVPQEPLYFFEQVYSLAKNGQIAREGSFTQFGEKDLWGWKGIVYAKAPIHLQQELPENCLSMVLLNMEEVQAVQTFGYTRVLSMLGKQARYYPFPYWTDHYRENLLIKEVTPHSILGHSRRLVLPEANATLIDNHLYLKIDKNCPVDLSAETFPHEIPIALIPSLDQAADSCLTWSFDSKKPEAITLPNSKGAVMGGCMIVLVAKQEENIAKISEDGFLILLKNESWDDFWLAFKEKKVFKLKTAEERMNFSLIWA